MATYKAHTLGPVTLSYDQVVAALALAGWPQKLWATAAAVISAESSRDCTIYNDYLQGHYGLMQIGRQQHPDYFASLSNKYGWTDPVSNCTYGYKLYKEQGWGAWEGHSTGRYTGYLLQATVAVGNVLTQIKRDQLVPTGGVSQSTMGPHGKQAVLQSYLTPITQKITAIQLLKPTVEGIATVADDSAGVITAAGQASADVLKVTNLKLGSVLDWITDPGAWMRIAQILVGGAVVIVAVAKIAAPAATATASAVSPAAKIARKVVS